MKICKANGCDRDYHARGYCGTHYKHFIRPTTPEYTSWIGAKRRCYDKGSNRFYRYGGLGIKMCDRWKYSFENFLEDMGHKPSPSHSIERIDITKDYEPSNCRWATVAEQASNKSNNVFVTIDEKRMTLAECSRQYGISPSLLGRRVKKGLSGKDLIKRPRKNGKNGVCIRNHIVDGDNLYISPNGMRRCVKCSKIRRGKAV